MAVIFVNGKRSVLFPVKRDRHLPTHPTPLPPLASEGRKVMMVVALLTL